MPLVSIIIPCYNAEKYVAEAIQSALDQTYPHCEIIVIDDGSTDGSLDVIKAFGDRIRWETGPNRGGCAARNRGIELAIGEWVQFLDADDCMTPNKVAKQMELLENAAPYSIATCPWHHFDENGHEPTKPRSFWKNYPSGTDLLVDMWLDGGFFNPACWLVPRSLIQEVGLWNEELAADQDGEYFGRILLAANTVFYAPDTEVGYRKPIAANVSQSVSDKAMWSKFESSRIVSRLLEKKIDSPKARAAIRKRWIGLAVFCSKHSRIFMNEALKNLQTWPVPSGYPDRLRGFYLRSLAAVLGISKAIRFRQMICGIIRYRSQS